MNIKEIALFAWLPFLAADIGGILGGYLCPFFMKYFKMSVLNSRLAGVVVGALCMIGPDCIGLAANPYTAIVLFSLGGFAHQMISALINCLGADVFEHHEVATATGFIGTAAMADEGWHNYPAQRGDAAVQRRCARARLCPVPAEVGLFQRRVSSRTTV
jgi:ACS family hexuronate transporter-like MFS transporter